MELGAWETMNKNRKRPSKLELRFHPWVAYNIRSILVGDLACAWETFGGISMQLTHLSTVLNLAITENATIAMTYAAKVRTYARELPKFRTRGKEIANLLMEEGQSIERDVLRECGAATTSSLRNAELNRQKERPNERNANGKGQKGQGRMGEGEGKFRGK